MKKVVAIIMIIGVVGIIGFMGMYIQRQNETISVLKNDVQYSDSSVDRLNKENDELQDEIENLSNEVYKMQNGEAYNISVYHGDEKHTWSWDGKLFGSKSHTVIK